MGPFWGDFDALHLKRIRIQYLNPKPIQKVRKKAGKRSQNHKNAKFQIQQGNRILENGRLFLRLYFKAALLNATAHG